MSEKEIICPYCHRNYPLLRNAGMYEKIKMDCKSVFVCSGCERAFAVFTVTHYLSLQLDQDNIENSLVKIGFGRDGENDD